MGSGEALAGIWAADVFTISAKALSLYALRKETDQLTEELNWHGKGSSKTLDYEDHILLQLVHSTVEDVSIKEQMRMRYWG